jgi:3-oxoacyl-[acyl-carrier protein] reductase
VSEALSLMGRVAVVTGAGRGIGAATARAFAAAHAHVALLDKDGGAATRVAEEIAAAGGEAVHFEVDVTDSFAVERVIDGIVDESGRLDVLVNNAGIVRDARLEEVSDADFAATLDVNLRGALVCTRAAIPHMLREGRGRILSASSVVARMGNYGQTAYAASKGGIVGMTRAWARELGPKGITANAVAPGFIETDMLQGIPPKIVERFRARIPAGRLGTAEEVANVYLFLATDMAAFMNGAIVGVDGGLLLSC